MTAERFASNMLTLAELTAESCQGAALCRVAEFALPAKKATQAQLKRTHRDKPNFIRPNYGFYGIRQCFSLAAADI